MMGEGGLVTLGALAWLFLRLAEEGELKQKLIEQGYDPVQVARAVRYGRGEGARQRARAARCRDARYGAGPRLATGSKRSFSAPTGTLVGYSRVRQARQSAPAGPLGRGLEPLEREVGERGRADRLRAPPRPCCAAAIISSSLARSMP